MSEVEKTIQEEVNRYKEINKYGLKLNEQEVPLPPVPGEEGAAPADPAGGIPDLPPPAGDEDVADVPPADEETPEEEPVDPAEDDETEEIDITDLVNMTKNIKQELEKDKTDDSGVSQQMNGVFAKLGELEGKLGEMDQIIGKIDDLGQKVENIKPPTPQEKLEMRSLDSYPFNENPDEFFSKKQEEMKKSGKNEYVLTKDDIENYNKEEIKQSFNDRLNDDEIYT